MNIIFLEESVQNLEKTLDAYHKKDNTFKDIYKDACIYRFKNTYKITLKILKRYLKEASSNPYEIEKFTFHQLIDKAYEDSIIHSGIETWKKFRDYCIKVSEIYQEEVADEILKGIPIF